MFDSSKVRQDFPQLSRRINGKPLVYLDSTATSLKPYAVIDKEREYYTKYSANIFRGIYKISEQATAEYEKAREKVASFIRAPSVNEVIFTRNATESINLVAYSWVGRNVAAGDRIVVTIMEHHSNFVPWQQLAGQRGIELRIWNTNSEGELNINDLDKLITRKTKLLAITAVSNVLGTINSIKSITKLVKRLNPDCVILVDAAQAVPHLPVDVQDWGADFVAFSGHKMLGPTGVGVLWGRGELLEAMPPFLYGGEMISEVRVEQTAFKKIPHKFEAGTPNIAGVIGLGAAVDYLNHLGMNQVRHHEEAMLIYVGQRLAELPEVTVYGPRDARRKDGVVAFTLQGVHAHDIAQILDGQNICVRAGNHCAMPLHLHLGLSATARASFYVYTTKSDVDALIEGLKKVREVFL